ncbi:MAG: hypothetical protein ACI85N_001821 [Gammaproteobacteria bacterium]|jgi:hypothetical protein
MGSVIIGLKVLNPAQARDETFCPWLDLHEVNVEEIMLNNDEVGELTMDPNHGPECIKIPLVTSPDLYSSLCEARLIVYPVAWSKRKGAEHRQNNRYIR